MDRFTKERLIKMEAAIKELKEENKALNNINNSLSAYIHRQAKYRNIEWVLRHGRQK